MLKMISNLNKQNRLFFDVSLILLAAALVTLPIYMYGVPGGNDMYQHFQFAQTFYDTLMNGGLYPKLATDSNYGLGDVGVRFYPPLTYYVMSLFRFISGNWFEASWLYFLSFFFLSGLGVYLWAKEWFSANAAIAGAIAYIIVPYHLNQIYQATFYAEFTAAAVIPFCFLFITRVCQKGRLIDILGLAISYGFLILSHLPTIVMASLIFSIYTLFSLKKVNSIQTILKLVVSVLLSLLLSSFYWIRMITELGFVKHTNEVFSSQYYSYAKHFNFDDFWGLYAKLTSRHSSGEFAILLTLGFLIPSLFLYFMSTKKEKNYPIISIGIITFFALFMSLPMSTFVWENVQPLQKIQFPFRWLILFSLGASFFFAAGFDALVKNLKTPKRYISILAIALITLCIPYHIFRTMGHYFYYPKDYFITFLDSSKTRPSFECWWSSWVNVDNSENAKIGVPRPVLPTDKVVLNNRAFTIQSWAATERTFTLEAGQAGQVQVAIMFYPHWKAMVNDQSVEVTPTETGMISFPVPDEASKIRLYFQEPQFNTNAYYLAGFSWIFIFCLLIFTLFQNYKPKID